MSLALIEDDENADFSLDASPINLSKSIDIINKSFNNQLSQEIMDELSLSLFADDEDDEWSCTTEEINKEINGVMKVKPIPVAGKR